jgi:RimJ/RimL family protein N-acetyltransferase
MIYLRERLTRFQQGEFHPERAGSMFYPGDARVPEALRTDEFLLRPLRATDVTLDYDAVISSRAELLLGSGGTWPREGFTLEENLADLERHEQEHRDRVAFTYTVMNPAETECLGCLYIGPLERLLGHDGGSGEYLSDRTAYVSFWVRQSRLADRLDRRLLQALIPWFQHEWAFLHIMFIAQKVEERYIRLFEEMGLRFLYSLRPRQPFLDVALAYLLEPILNF